MQNVKIIKGFLNNGEMLENIVLPMTLPITQANGPFKTNYVGFFDLRGIQGFRQQKKARVFFISETHFEMNTEEPVEYTLTNDEKNNFKVDNEEPDDFIEPIEEKTDDEIREELKEKFFILELISKGIAEGQVKSLVVTGSPGTGKSYGIDKMMKEAERNNPNFYYNVIKGTVSAIKLYSILWECRERNCVVIVDDCDIEDVECFNMLKAATDSSRRRTISYNKLSTYLEENDIPNSFEFKGGLIYLSNVNLERGKNSSKLKPHIDAFISRAHYIDVTLYTKREQLIRVMQVAQTEEFCVEHKVTQEQVNEICSWVQENSDIIREISIRLITKICDLLKTFDSNWSRVAKITLCSNKSRRMFA